MVVLLAGGAGYIGSHTAVELLNAGHEVVIVDDYSNSCPESIKRVEEITGKSIVSYEADVKDKEAMTKIFADNKIDCVIHFAGLKAVGESTRLPAKYYRNNIDISIQLEHIHQVRLEKTHREFLIILCLMYHRLRQEEESSLQYLAEITIHQMVLVEEIIYTL